MINLRVFAVATGCKVSPRRFSGQQAHKADQRFGDIKFGQVARGSRRRTRHRYVPFKGTARSNDRDVLVQECTPDDTTLTSKEIRIIAIECVEDEVPSCPIPILAAQPSRLVVTSVARIFEGAGLSSPVRAAAVHANLFVR